MADQPTVAATQTLLNWREILRSDAVVLAVATLLGYSFVFAYEAGVCFEFGVPITLISLNLATAFAVAVPLLVAYFSYLNANKLLLDSLSAKTDEDARRVARKVTTLFLWLAIGGSLLHFSTFILTLLFLLIVFGDSLTAKLVTFLRRKLTSSQPLSRDQILSSFDILDRLPARMHLAMSGVALLLTLTMLYGRSRATSEVQFITTVGARTYAVVRIYGDTIITVPCRFGTSKPTFGGPYDSVLIEKGLRIFKVGDKSGPEDLLPATEKGFVQLDRPPRPVWQVLLFSES
jgi:hypothetical protein